MNKFALHIFLSSIESETRLYKEAAYCLKNGIYNKVSVLGLWNEGLAVQETTDYGLEIWRLRTIIRRYRSSLLLRRFGLLRKFVAVLSFIQYSLRCIIVTIKARPDHISCHNAVMLPIAFVSARLSGATLEYLPHELETQRTGLNGIYKRAIILIEWLFIHSARNVVVVCDPIREWYENAYNLKNVYVVRNVPEKDAIHIRELPSEDFRKKFDISDNAKVFIYQGLFSAGRGIENLLECFKNLDPNKCHLVLMGYGESDYQDIIDISSQQYPNIHFHPAVEREWIISYSASADVGIFISERASLSYRYALPNKFFEWAHAGLPIIVSENLEYQAKLLREGNFGWSGTVDELTETVDKISQIDLTEFTQNARKYSVDAVWEKDAKVFAQVYSDQTNKGFP